MKCCFCNNESDILMTDGRSICLHCAETKGLVICSKMGKVIADTKFHCDYVCNDCVYMEDKIR